MQAPSRKSPCRRYSLGESAYFVTVMEEDQQSFFNTLEKYNIGFLASNKTYATESEIENQACKMPHYITSALEWTAGVTPLAVVWVVYTIFSYLRLRCGKKNVYKTPIKQIKKTVDKPPRAPKKNPRTEHVEYIRSNRPPKREVEMKESFAGKIIQNISPSLRKRMMPPDV